MAIELSIAKTTLLNSIKRDALLHYFSKRFCIKYWVERKLINGKWVGQYFDTSGDAEGNESPGQHQANAWQIKDGRVINVTYYQTIDQIAD